ncbi:MAG: LPS export ABC transporter periplasmic protein LptC [Bdellovibrionales bacterium]|nr:LPS export ABC transporter periplasmic protein LptC [Bdellovibrionales bacterium]
MHINKKTSYILSGLIVISFFGVGTFFLGNDQSSPSLSPPPGPEEQEAPDSLTPSMNSQSDNSPAEIGQADDGQGESPEKMNIASPREDTPLPEGESDSASGVESEEPQSSEGFALKDFHRSETRNGKLLWEIVGTNARYFPDEKRVDIEHCLFSMLDKKEKQVILRAKNAKLYLEGAGLRSAFFSSDVVLDYGSDIKILTDEALYEHDKEFVSSDAHVKVIGSWYMVEGDGLRAHLKDESYEILHNVSSVIEPKKREEKQSS